VDFTDTRGLRKLQGMFRRLRPSRAICAVPLPGCTKHCPWRWNQTKAQQLMEEQGGSWPPINRNGKEFKHCTSAEYP
jgi:hypothetical protein